MIDGFGYDDTLLGQERALRVLKLFEPMQVDGFGKVRLGRDNDGGYVMLDDFDGVEAAYSLGINDDVSWDLAMAERGIDVFQYDHTIDRLPQEHPRFHWSRIGISATPDPEKCLDALPALMAHNGHAQATELILKCDIEGSEWDMFATMATSDVDRFRQIVVEMHAFQALNQPFWAEKLHRAAANLALTHHVVHVHANNNAAYAIVGGVPVPAVLEITFVRKRGKTMRPTDETFPTALDQPCFPGRADYRLGHFRF